MSEETRPDSVIVSRYELGDYDPPTKEQAAAFERPALVLTLGGSRTLLLGQVISTLADGAYRGGARLTLPRRSVLVADAPAASVMLAASPRATETCVGLTFRRVAERMHSAMLQLHEAAVDEPPGRPLLPAPLGAAGGAAPPPGGWLGAAAPPPFSVAPPPWP